ncbi:MAG: DUF4160 domain-containing protein [Anaerolineales bacterium]
MSPTIYREGQYRFYFNSNEESRQHVHVEGQNGKAKFWLEPILALADYHGLKAHELKEIEKMIDKRQQEFKDAWNAHFPR